MVEANRYSTERDGRKLPSSRLVGSISLFLFGISHRLLQMWLLWPQLARAIPLAAGRQDTTLLPADIMREHPWWGLWYLQQTPPIPTAIFGFVLALWDTPNGIAISFLVLQGVLSSLTAVAMGLLLRRLGIRWAICLMVSTIFLLSADLLVIEYQGMGQKFYNLLTMLLLVLSCHSALTLTRRLNWGTAVGLGLCVAFLALTRASFAFFWPVVLIWLLAAGAWRRPVLIVAYLVPVLALQGGWSLKNYAALGYWSWSASSWGGANLLHAEVARHGDTEFQQWLQGHPPICESPWQELTMDPPPRLFNFFPFAWPDGAIPPEISSKDDTILAHRGYPAPFDTMADGQWSRCLQREVLKYWEHRPGLAIREAWWSYMLYWEPIRQFAAFFPLIKPDMKVYSQKLNWWRGLRDSWREVDGRYSMVVKVPKVELFKPSDFVPVRVLVLPVIPSIVSSLNFVILHSLSLLVLWRLFRGMGTGWPTGFGFLLVAYGYQAALSSFGEFGENMRYRLEAEPIIWTISIVTLCLWGKTFRPREPSASYCSPVPTNVPALPRRSAPSWPPGNVYQARALGPTADAGGTFHDM